MSVTYTVPFISLKIPCHCDADLVKKMMKQLNEQKDLFDLQKLARELMNGLRMEPILRVGVIHGCVIAVPLYAPNLLTV